MTRGAGLVAPPIGGRGRTVVLNRRDVAMYIRIVYTQQESIEVQQVTGSLLILLIICCCILLCLRSYCESLCVRELLPQLLFQLVCLIDNTPRTVTVYHISGAMASGDSRPKADRCGISFRNQLQVPWNAPESIVTKSNQIKSKFISQHITFKKFKCNNSQCTYNML